MRSEILHVTYNIRITSVCCLVQHTARKILFMYSFTGKLHGLSPKFLHSPRWSSVPELRRHKQLLETERDSVTRWIFFEGLIILICTSCVCTVVIKIFQDFTESEAASFNPHQNDQGRKGPCLFQRLIALKCLKCQKIFKKISNPPLGGYLFNEPNFWLIK